MDSYKVGRYLRHSV